MQVREIKRRLNGTSQVFFCDLIYQDEDAMVIRFQPTQDPYTAMARVTEGYFWRGRTYLTYKMFDYYGDLVGHRFDVCRDVHFGPDSVEWTDLVLDCFVTPAGDLQVLDEDEVAGAIADGQLDAADQEIISCTRALLEAEYQAIIQEAAAIRRRAQNGA